MAGKESTTKEAPVGAKATTAEEQEVARLRRERDTLKAQLAGTVVRTIPPVKFETTNPSEATLYESAGGILVSITKLYPNSMKSGKRYGFAQTKADLDALVKTMNEEGRG